MQPSALCAPAGPLPNRWAALCALQGLLPLLKKAEAGLDRPNMIYWFGQAHAELADIIRGRPSGTAAIPALIARSPQMDFMHRDSSGTRQ